MLVTMMLVSIVNTLALRIRAATIEWKSSASATPMARPMLSLLRASAGACSSLGSSETAGWSKVPRLDSRGVMRNPRKTFRRLLGFGFLFTALRKLGPEGCVGWLCGNASKDRNQLQYDAWL